MIGVPKWFIYLNAFLRFALEVTAIVVLAIWGWHKGSGIWAAALVIGLPLAAAGIWWAFVAPRAPWFLPLWGRLAVELLIFGAATFALIDLGNPVLAVNFAVLAIANSLLIHLHRDDERVRKGLPLADKKS
jgi:hypothetical protein